MKITWKKVTAAVVAFFGIGALTACYGMPPHEDEDNDRETVEGENSPKRRNSFG